MLLAATSDENLTTALICGLVVACAALAFMLAQERKRRLLTEQALKAERARPTQQLVVQSRADGEREDREKQIADLHIAKLKMELEFLQRQLAGRDVEADRLEAAKEGHELMVEKTRLEIDSMRLHIAEMRKRMEDWGSGHE